MNAFVAKKRAKSTKLVGQVFVDVTSCSCLANAVGLVWNKAEKAQIYLRKKSMVLWEEVSIFPCFYHCPLHTVEHAQKN